MASVAELSLRIGNNGEKFVCVSKGVDSTWQYRKKKNDFVIRSRNAVRLICCCSRERRCKSSSYQGIWGLLPLSHPHPMPRYAILAPRTSETEIGVARRGERDLKLSTLCIWPTDWHAWETVEDRDKVEEERYV